MIAYYTIGDRGIQSSAESNTKVRILAVRVNTVGAVRISVLKM